MNAMPPERHANLKGDESGVRFVGGVDVAGQDAALAPGQLERSAVLAARDSTVVTVARLSWTAELEPAVEVLQHYSWTGAYHSTQHHALRHLLTEVWPCTRIVVDATKNASYSSTNIGWYGLQVMR